jgi:hypothetical protein
MFPPVVEILSVGVNIIKHTLIPMTFHKSVCLKIGDAQQLLFFMGKIMIDLKI